MNMILSEQNINEIDFQKSNGLVPAIIQDGNSGQVLMLGYMDRDAVLQTFKLKRVTFYSRSKERLWTKGESSGHYLKFKEMCLDCDADSLLIQADPMGPTCHTGADSCFGNEKWGLSFIEHLQGVIADRQRNPSTTSYTSSLFDKGIDKIAQKVGEEAVETVIEAKNENRDKFLGETADLLFHLLILLKAKNVNIQDVLKVLMQRHK